MCHHYDDDNDDDHLYDSRWSILRANQTTWSCQLIKCFDGGWKTKRMMPLRKISSTHWKGLDCWTLSKGSFKRPVVTFLERSIHRNTNAFVRLFFFTFVPQERGMGGGRGRPNVVQPVRLSRTVQSNYSRKESRGPAPSHPYCLLPWIGIVCCLLCDLASFFVRFFPLTSL